jgi:hypothetical protein
MFGLPWSTTLLVLGFPLLWVLYTLVFLVLSRNWAHEEGGRGDER